MALFVKLDANWPDHPKMLRAGIDGAGLHATALCLAKRNETDGWVDRLLLVRYGATDELIDRLISLGLFDAEGDMVQPHGWHDRNPSQGAIDATRATKAEAAKVGNHRRWNHGGEVADCPKCSPKPTSSHGAIATESHPNRSHLPCDRPDTESDPETEPEPSPLNSQEILTTPADPDAAPSDQQQLTPDELEQAIRRTAVAVGVEAAKAPGVGNPPAYATATTRTILSGPDPSDRDRIAQALRSGESSETIAAGWSQPGPRHDPDVIAAAADRARLLEAETAAVIADRPPRDDAEQLARVRAIRERAS